MYKKSILAGVAGFIFALCSLPAQGATDTITIAATLGPILRGSDPAGANGGAGTITIMVNEALKPTAHTARSATYTLRAGNVSVVVNGQSFTTTGPSKLTYSFPAAGPDTLVLSGHATVQGVTISIVGTAALANGSFTRAVLRHPQAFTPASQPLTAAATAKGKGSKLSYSFVGSTTVLGLSGTASN